MSENSHSVKFIYISLLNKCMCMIMMKQQESLANANVKRATAVHV